MPLPDAPSLPPLRRPAPAGSGPTEPAGRSARRRASRRLRTILWRARFVVAAICCGLAAAAVVQAVRPAPPPTVGVVVPARPLAAGEPVRADDLTSAAVPAALAPADVVTDAAAVVGRSPAVPLPAGLPLHADLLPGGGVAALAPDGTVVVPVRLDDAAAGWLSPGDRVDLVVTGEAARSSEDDEEDDEEDGEKDGDDGYLARRAMVLPTPDGGDDHAASGGLLGAGGPSSGGGDVTLVAVAADDAPRLSAASGWGTVGAVLVP